MASQAVLPGMRVGANQTVSGNSTRKAPKLLPAATAMAGICDK